MTEPCGHPCPECHSELVYVIKFSRNEKGTFYNSYKCAACGKEFESTPSHKERDDEK